MTSPAGELQLDTSRPVLVTGATGYVAGWIVRRLLEEGFTVHAAVRDPSNAEKLKHLNALAAELPGQIAYFAADLLQEGSYAEAMSGCGVVFHTASPFTLNVQDPKRDLLEPAELGTRNVLQQANQTESVTRVVVTSSVAAVFGDNQDLQDAPGEAFTEDDWNTTSRLDHQPYSFSKVRAEKEAWKIAQAQERWSLVTVNPSLVLGPGINPRATSESFTLIKQLVDGSMSSGAPDYPISVVDVRDVAEQHLRAAFMPSASGRFIASAQDASFLALAESVREQFGDTYKVPAKAVPKWIIWLLGPLMNKAMSRRTISRNIGWPLRISNAKATSELGMSYRPLGESMADMVKQMSDEGVL